MSCLQNLAVKFPIGQVPTRATRRAPRHAVKAESTDEDPGAFSSQLSNTFEIANTSCVVLLLCLTHSASAGYSLGNPSSTVSKSRKVVGCGGVGIDYLASVAAYPKPDEKLRTQALQVRDLPRGVWCYAAWREEGFS